MLDGKEVWIHYSYLVKQSHTSKLRHLKSKDSVIYSKLAENAESKKVGKKRTNAVYYIKEEAQVRRNTYYLISTDSSREKGFLAGSRRGMNYYDYKLMV